MSVLLARYHWIMRNDVRIRFKSDVSVENRNFHFSQVEEKHTILSEMRSGDSAHQWILKDNNDQAAGSQFQELGCILCQSIVPCSVKLFDSTTITEQHPWRPCQTLELWIWLC